MGVNWVERLKRLRVDRAAGTPAPHKPILLLAVLDMIEQSLIIDGKVVLSPDLAFRFLSYWDVVAARARRLGRAELPFFYLRSDGVWSLVAIPGLEAVLEAFRPTSVDRLNKVVSHAEINSDFLMLLRSPSGLDRARQAILSGGYFTQDEKLRLYAILGLTQNETSESLLAFSAEADSIAVGRNIRFRMQIVPTYQYTCALCRLKVLTPQGKTVVEAAHIHRFSDSKNNDVRNGVALCRNHHWSFDQGLWTVGEDNHVLVATQTFIESSPQNDLLTSFQGKPLHYGDISVELIPDKRHYDWHRAHVFIG